MSIAIDAKLLRGKTKMEQRARVLVVDDDPVFLRGLQQTLAAARFDAVPACDGAQALALASAQPLDLILSDHRMPRLSGLELLARLRQAGSFVPFIMMTAYDADSIVEAARVLGAAAVLEKPLEFGTLIRCCEEVLGARGGVAANSRKAAAPPEGQRLTNSSIATAPKRDSES